MYQNERHRYVRRGWNQLLKIEYFVENYKNDLLVWPGFELGTSDFQTDALDHSANLEDVEKDWKITR